MKKEIQTALEKPFPADKIKTKNGQGGRRMSYISHGLVTERLNDADPDWSSKVVEVHKYTDPNGALHCAGVTIALTVGGVTREESGGPQRVETFANEIKNAQSDALKRAAMRFGVALENWESLIDAEGDEDYTDEGAQRPRPQPAQPPQQQPIPIREGAAGGATFIQAVHAAATGKVEGQLHQRVSAAAQAVYGVPSMRDLTKDQAERLRKAFGECRHPQDGEALIALAIRTNAATSTDELDQVAKDIGVSGFGPERLELMRDAFRRSTEAIKLLAEVNGNQPPLLGATGTAGADSWTR